MKIAIIGATGKVGRMMLTCLDEAKIPYKTLDLYASERSAGQKIEHNGKEYTVQKTTKSIFKKGYDYVLFSAGGSVAKEFAPFAVENGSVVIDNSSAFRREENIPLVVPEINGRLLKNYHGIIANPNCSTIQLVLPLYGLNKFQKIKKVVVTTLQSVSGSGYKGIIELQNQRKGIMQNNVYPRQIDLNVIPQIGEFVHHYYAEEELKLAFETRKILNLPKLNVSSTNVRVPVVYGHSLSVYVEFWRKTDLHLLRDMLWMTDSVKMELDNGYITPLEIGESDISHVGRLRWADDDKSIMFWCVAHNVRLGAATNAVKILKQHLTGRWW